MKGMMLAVATAAALVAVAGSDGASYRWTPTKAETRVKATYRTVDTVEPDAPMAIVKKATCQGAGKPVNHRFSRFRCTAEMIGWGEYAGDGFHAKHKLTVTVTGPFSFRWRKGWG